MSINEELKYGEKEEGKREEKISYRGKPLKIKGFRHVEKAVDNVDNYL